MAAYCRVYDSHHVQADCQEQLWEPTLGNRVWATFYFKQCQILMCVCVFREHLSVLRVYDERSYQPIYALSVANSPGVFPILLFYSEFLL